MRGKTRACASSALLLSLLFLPESTPGAAPPAPDPGDAVLAKFAVAPTTAGLRSYLRTLDRARAAALIPKLASESFEEREAATRALGRLGVVVLPELEKAARESDPELRRRARRVLEDLEADGSLLLLRALEVARERRTAGLVLELLRLAPSFPDGPFALSLDRTLRECARPGDAPVLRAALRDRSARVRVTALSALGEVLGPGALPEARKLLADRDDRVRLEAVRLLIPHAPRDTLGPLVGLLRSDDFTVRLHSARWLGALTGQHHFYEASDPPEDRRSAIYLWEDWLKEHGKTATLKPLLPGRQPRLGRTLVCLIGESPGMVELDEAGKQTRLGTDVGAVCGCQGSPDGRRYLACWDRAEVVEMDAAGKVVWHRIVVAALNSLHRLEDGSILVGSFNGQKLYLVKRDGAIPWEIDVPGNVTDARRLDNGRTLVALFGTNLLVEVDAAGKEVWRIEKVPSPESARRLGNGHTLVASSTGKVLEYDRGGKVVWSYERDLPRAYDALELESGNILIGYQRGLREVTRTGKVVREVRLGTVRRIDRY